MMYKDKCNYIKIYPSNWLYNAAVIGFLEIVEKSEEKVEEFLKNDGGVEFQTSLFKKINVENFYFSNDKVASIIGNSPLYRNYLQQSWKQAFLEFVSTLEFLKVENHCDICVEGKYLDPCIFKSSKNKDIIDKFLSGIRVFDVRLNNLLAPSVKFPNSFWNNNSSLIVCDFCGYVLIHHHIPFENAKTQSGQIFINAPSFKVMWYLNKFIGQILNKNRKNQLREILGISLIEFAQKVAVTLGAWSIMNIEMIIKKYDSDKRKEYLEYYSLPYQISKILLHKDIASLISATKEPLILEIILKGDFDLLLTLSHKVLRYTITSSSISDDKYLSQLKNKDLYSLKNLSIILPELYVKINSIISREVMV